jgi:hypothetical protein
MRPNQSTEGITIYKISAANSRADYENDTLTKGFLDAMAAFANEQKPALLFNHDPSTILGKVFKAEVAPLNGHDGHFELIEYVYVLNSFNFPGQPDTKAVEAINEGILDFVSVRFRGPYTWDEKAENPGRVYAPNGSTEITHPETSFVWFGMQRDAKKKAFDYTIEDNPKTKTSKIKSMNLDFIGKTFSLEVAGDEVKGIKALEDHAKEQINAATDAQKSAETERDNLKTEVESFKTKTIDRIKALQGKDCLNLDAITARTDDDLKGYDMARLSEYREVLEKKFAGMASNPALDSQGNPITPDTTNKYGF